MKKSLSFMVLVFVLVIGLCTGAIRQIDEQIDDIQFEETRLFGDPAAAEGITLDMDFKAVSRSGIIPRYLIWNTRLPLGEGNTPETAVDFLRPEAYDVEEEKRLARLTFSSQVGHSSIGTIILEEEAEHDPYGVGLLYPMLKDIADAIPIGSEINMTVRLRDYFENYPVAIGIADSMNYLGNIEEVEAALRDYFRYPVDPDCKLVVTIDKRSDELLDKYGIHEMESDVELGIDEADYPVKAPDWNCNLVQTEEGVYFTVSSVTEHYGQHNGLYFMPFKGTDRKGAHLLDTSALRKIYALGESEYVDFSGASLESLKVSENCIEMVAHDYTGDQKRFHLVQVERKTGRVLQDMHIPGGTYVHTWGDDQILLAVFKNQCILLEKDGAGIYRQVFQFQSDENDYLGNSACDYRYRWDGERLCIAFLMADVDDYGGWHEWQQVSVYDTQGRSYGAKFEATIGQNVIGERDRKESRVTPQDNFQIEM